MLAPVSVLLNLAILIRGGIRLGGDSPGYISSAQDLLKGHVLAGRPGLWLGYKAIIALCHVLGLGLGGVIVLQLGVAAIAATAQYHLGEALGGRWTGWVAAMLLVANADIARFHAFILTDSLYTSMVILAVWCVHRAAERRGGRYRLMAARAAVLVAAMLRPNGSLLLPITAGYWILRSAAPRWCRWLTVVGIGPAFLVAVLALPQVQREISFEDPGWYLRRGEIVTGFHQGWQLPMPAGPDAGGRDASAFLGYVARHPVATLSLAAARVGAELIHVRPFYSARHNAILLVCLPPLYGLALLGFVRARRQPLARLLAAVIGVDLLIVAIVGANWDGRYLLFTFPLICVFSACAFASRVQSSRGEPG